MVALAVWLVSAFVVAYSAVIALYAVVAAAFVPFLVLGVLLSPLVMLVYGLQEGHRERLRTRGRYFGPLPRAGASARLPPPPPYRAPSCRLQSQARSPRE